MNEETKKIQNDNAEIFDNDFEVTDRKSVV